MDTVELNDAFWKVSRESEEWQLLFNSYNQITFLTSYFNNDRRFNKSFSLFLLEQHKSQYFKLALLYVQNDYKNHIHWIRNSDIENGFKERIEEVWQLQNKKKQLFNEWTQQLSDLEFDLILYYFSGYFGANVNSRALWHDKKGFDILFMLFMREAYSHYITEASKTGIVRFKWMTGETPDWSLKEHSVSSIRFQRSHDSDPVMEHFRQAVTGIFLDYVSIESKLLLLIGQENAETNDGNAEEKSSEQSEMNFGDPKLELSWYSLLHLLIGRKDLSEADLHWLLNSIGKQSNLIPAGVIATLFLHGSPDKLCPGKRFEVDLVKWSVALSEFVKFQLPDPFPAMGMFQREIEQRKRIFEEKNPIGSLKSLHIISKEKVFKFFHELYGFSLKEIRYVFGAMTYKLGFSNKYQFHLFPFIETAEGDMIISMPMLSRISWPNQLIVSLSGMEQDAVRQEIADYREKLVGKFLDMLGLQTYCDLKLVIDGNVRGNVDALAITDNAVYFFEVKGIDKIKGYYDLHQRVLEKIESEAVDQLFRSISSRNRANIEFSDANRRAINIPQHLKHKAIILSNMTSIDGRSHSGIAKSSIIELGLLCSAELQKAFLNILEFFYPDKSVIPSYQRMFENISKSPELALKTLEEGSFWKEIRGDLA